MSTPGNTWIFLRGLTRESRHWGDFSETFRSVMIDANVIALDLPGNGSLHTMHSPCSVAAMSEYCRDELARCGLRPPYNVLAMSLGAMVATAWATQHPDEIGACVLINTSMRPFSAFHQRLRPGNYAALLKLVLLGGSASEWEETILRITSRHAAAHADVLKRWVACRQEFPVSRRNAIRQLIAAARYRAPGVKPAVRMLILTSTHDALVDTRCSQALAIAWNCRIAAHPDAGHDIPLDDGPWVAQQIRDWLEE
ncbi:MAG: hydrolase or acyltransferase-like protein [Rhodocyclales bacterium]|nr:hydrolase or acyltransferase-like protein [Rhodocyclales bacterium]